jgi:hypothetical protein
MRRIPLVICEKGKKRRNNAEEAIDKRGLIIKGWRLVIRNKRPKIGRETS